MNKGFIVYLAGFLFLMLSPHLSWGATPSNPAEPVYVIPIRDDIEDSILYLIRRGFHEASENKAQAVILDMDTNGGKIVVTEEIMDLIEHFDGKTITYVNRKAYSAGAMIAVSTKEIYMAPSSVIGAAAPIMINPSGGVEALPDTVQNKITSAVAGRIRAAAQQNGHRSDIVDAMVRQTDGLKIDGVEIVKPGEILTLTDQEATRLVGKPPQPLLAKKVVKNMDDLLALQGYSKGQVHQIEPTGMEKIARWITGIAPILLLIGIGGIYMEFKTPGISIFGVVGTLSLVIFFFGHYIAGLSGYEEILLFVIGLILIGVEIFIFPGFILPGMLGILAILVSLYWAMVELAPGAPILPAFGLPRFQIPFFEIAMSMGGALLLVILLGRWLPHTQSRLGGLITQMNLDHDQGFTSSSNHTDLIGQSGLTITPLRPSGTARFQDRIVDVASEGDFIDSGQRIMVKEVRGVEIIVRKEATS